MRLRGDAFSGGRHAVAERGAMHRLWKDGMKTAQLLDLGAEVARSHWWLYRQEEEDEAPGALPPGGVQGTYLEGLCCGFIWPKMVRGERTNNLKYCYACNKHDNVKRWLCPGCRDTRPISGPDVAHCMPGYCPALARRFDGTWHTAELKRPQWFKEWAEDARHANFKQWNTGRRVEQLHRWYPGFLAGHHTHQLSEAQREARSAVDPWRARATTLTDDSSLSNRVRLARGA